VDGDVADLAIGVDDRAGLQRDLHVVGHVPGGLVGVQVAGGDRGVGRDPGGHRPAGVVEGAGTAGTDVQYAGDLLLLVDGQRTDRELRLPCSTARGA
jgi:hypothetical protein